VIVSTAAGSVGSCVGQLAIEGFERCNRWRARKGAPCLEEFGSIAAIDTKGVADLDGAIKAACPDGVDVYYDKRLANQ